MLIAQCAGSCWEAEVMLSSSSPCPPEPHQGRCGRAEQEHSKAGSSSSATVPLKLLRREFLPPLCQRRGAEAGLVSVSPTQELTKQEHVWKLDAP